MLSRRSFLAALAAPSLLAGRATAARAQRAVLLPLLWAHKRLRPRSMGDPLGVHQSCQIYNNEAEIDATRGEVRALARKS